MHHRLSFILKCAPEHFSKGPALHEQESRELCSQRMVEFRFSSVTHPGEDVAGSSAAHLKGHPFEASVRTGAMRPRPPPAQHQTRNTIPSPPPSCSMLAGGRGAARTAALDALNGWCGARHAADRRESPRVGAPIQRCSLPDVWSPRAERA